MQVFLILLDADGRVVSRNELFAQCWGGIPVGDDSLNRAIARVRKIEAATAPGFFEVESIPRTGYRIAGEVLRYLDGSAESAGPTSVWKSRRAVVLGGAAAAALAGSAGLVAWRRSSQADFNAVMARGNEAFRNGFAFEQERIRENRNVPMVKLYEEAVRLNPDSARAWGLLAYFRTAMLDDAAPPEAAAQLAGSQATIRRALELDPQEPNARLAKFLLEWPMNTLFERDRTLRAILKTDSNNLLAMAELMPLLQAAGLTRESWAWNERILRASPMARPFLCVRALKLWILGRVREADNVIDRVRGLWPDYRFGNYVRFNIFALTGRPEAARAMLDTILEFRSLKAAPVMNAVLDAIEKRTASAIEVARTACVATARETPPLVNDVIMYLGALGLTETAFEVTEGFLLWRGKIVSEAQKNGKTVDDYNRRMTQWLFTPPLAAMRADPRFPKLCEDFGLTDYWRARNVRPDYQVYG